MIRARPEDTHAALCHGQHPLTQEDGSLRDQQRTYISPISRLVDDDDRWLRCITAVGLHSTDSRAHAPVPWSALFARL